MMRMMAQRCRRSLARMAAPVVSGVCLVLLAPSRANGTDWNQEKPVHPNIIIFLVDDMGWQDTSVQFHTERTVWNDLYRTPNMQRLANRGMRFTNAYAASPVCSPTRTSILTGRNPARTSISDWVGHGISANRHVTSPAWAVDGLQPGDGNTTLPSILQRLGYRTALVGKAHFGANGTPGANPLNLGFDINIGGSHVGSPRGQGAQGAYFAPFPTATMPELNRPGHAEYITQALTDEASAIIKVAAADEKPLFMLLSHYAIHTPINGQGDPRFISSYRDANRPKPEDDYAAMIESMDASLGAILDQLEQCGVAQSTLIVFASDNGGLSNHTRNFGGVQTVRATDGIDIAVNFARDEHNAPLRGGKGSAYEGGVRVPMIIAWAGQQPGATALNVNVPIPPGSRSHEPIITDDFFPTLLSIAGAPDIAKFTDDGEGRLLIDGRDLTPILQGEPFTRDGGIYFHYPHQWYRDIGVGEGIEPFTAIRDGDYKLIFFYGDGAADGQGDDPRWELYNLAADTGENENLIGSHLEVAFALRTRLAKWMSEVKAQVPMSKLTGLPIQLPIIER